MARRYDPSRGKMTKCMSPEHKVGTGRCTHLGGGVQQFGSTIEVKPESERTQAEANMIEATGCKEIVDLPGVTLTTDGEAKGRLKVDPKDVDSVVKQLNKEGVKVIKTKSGNNNISGTVTAEGALTVARRYNAKTVAPLSNKLNTEEMNTLGVQGILINGDEVVTKEKLSAKQIAFLKQKNLKLAKRSTEITDQTVVVENGSISKVTGTRGE